MDIEENIPDESMVTKIRGLPTFRGQILCKGQWDSLSVMGRGGEEQYV